MLNPARSNPLLLKPEVLWLDYGTMLITFVQRFVRSLDECFCPLK